MKSGTEGGPCHGSGDRRRPLTADERVQTQAKPMPDLWWIKWHWDRFSRQRHSTNDPHSFIQLSPTLYNLRTRQRRWEVTSADSYSERPGFKSPPGDRLSWMGLAQFCPLPQCECLDSTFKYITTISFQILSTLLITLSHTTLLTCVVEITVS